MFLVLTVLAGCDGFDTYQGKTAQQWHDEYKNVLSENEILDSTIKDVKNAYLDEMSIVEKQEKILQSIKNNSDVADQLNYLDSQNQEIMQQNEDIKDNLKKMNEYQNCLAEAKLLKENSADWCPFPP